MQKKSGLYLKYRQITLLIVCFFLIFSLVAPVSCARDDKSSVLLLLTYNQGLSIDEELLPEDSIVINRPVSSVEMPVWIASLIIGCGSGLLIGIIVLVYSNGKLRQTKKQLRQSEDRLSKAITATNDGLWDWNIRTGVAYFSPAYNRMLGYEPDEIPGRFDSWVSMIHTDDRERVVRDLNQYLTSGKTGYNIGYRVISKTGDELFVHARGEVVEWVDGEPARIIGTNQDVTEMRRSQNALEKSENSLREANRKQNILLSITGHDILNQITGITGYCELLRENAASDPVALEYFNRVERMFQNIQQQIQFAKDYHKIGVNKPVWQNLETVVMRAVKSMSSANMKVNVSINSVEVFADSMLEKVFFNLIDNSLRHSGGATEFTFSFSKEGENAIIIAADNGRGVPEEKKEAIFKRGFGANSGYGLFLIREILAITGMDIRETGVYGEGVRFEITLLPETWRYS